jgi:prevent-host-death family protein
MIKKTSALTARKNFGQLLEEAYYRGDEIIIERAGKAMAVIISIEEFRNWQIEREKDFSILDQVRASNKGAKLGNIEKDVDEAIKAVRERK